MKNLIKQIKSFKIIPDKFRSSTIFEVEKFNDDTFCVNLQKTKELNLEDYVVGEAVEIFGLGNDGLIYFTSIIEDKNECKIALKYPDKHKNIQRREYPRVKFDGKLILEDFEKEKATTSDISAGGIKFSIKRELEMGHVYDIILILDKDNEIKCAMEIINATAQNNDYNYRGKFLNLDSTLRVNLIQHTFKILLESENKQD